MAEEQNQRELLSRLVERLDHLESLLQAQTARLYAVERRLGIEAPPPAARRRPLYESLTDEREETRAADAATQAAPPVAGSPLGLGQTPQRREAREDARAADAATGETYDATGETRSDGGAQVPPARAPRAADKPRDLESVIGGVWFAWAGILAVVFTVAFVLKSAFENNWLGAGARVGMGALAGVALLVAGERLRRRGLRLYAYILSGGGLLSFYLTTYAAHTFYGMMPQPVAFLLMTLVTASAVLLAVRLDALPVAVLGLVGGFLTPPLLSTGQDNQVALFAYVALLDAGVLAVGYFKRWRSLDFLSFAATVLMTFGWMLRHYDHDKLWTTLFFLALLFVLYTLLAVFHNVLPRRRSRWFDVALLAANATLYFSTSYILLDDAHRGRTLPAALALALAGAFAALFYAARARCAEDRLLANAYVGAGVTFLTAAVAIQLELQWVTIVWAVEGLMLTWVGLRSGEPAARRAALGVFAAAASHWLLFDARTFGFDAFALAEGSGGGFVPFANARALSCLLLVAALATAARLYRRESGVHGVREREGFAAAYTLAANALSLTLLSLDLSDYFGRRKALSEGLAAERAENARQFSLTALWAIYGASLVAYGARRSLTAARYAGLLLLAAATAKALALDVLYFDATWHAPVFNHTFMAFAVLVAGYAAAARFYAREGSGAAEAASVIPVLTVAANALALLALSVEAVGYFEARAVEGAEGRRDVALAKQLSLSVVWALYGAGLLAWGRARGAKLLRLLGLGLLALTTLKVFVLDLSELDRAYRIVSFIVLGAILLGVSYLYQRSQQRAAAAAEAEEAAASAEPDTTGAPG